MPLCVKAIVFMCRDLIAFLMVTGCEPLGVFSRGRGLPYITLTLYSKTV